MRSDRTSDDGDIGLSTMPGRAQALDPIGSDELVVVEEADDRCFGVCEDEVPSTGDAPDVVDDDARRPMSLGEQFRDPCTCVVFGGAVDDDQFVAVLQLRQDRLERIDREVAAVARGERDTQPWTFRRVHRVATLDASGRPSSQSGSGTSKSDNTVGAMSSTFAVAVGGTDSPSVHRRDSVV